MLVAPIAVVFDGFTAWTVNHMDIVPSGVNRLVHLFVQGLYGKCNRQLSDLANQVNQLSQENQDKMNSASVFVQVVENPERKAIIKRGRTAKE